MWDVAIIGGGVIGLACAFELSRRGRQVVVIERDQPGRQASWVAAGLLGTAALPLGDQDDIHPLKLDSLRCYPQFISDVESASGMNAGYRTEGTLWVARSEDEDEQLERLHAERLERGLHSRRLSASEVASLEPSLSPNLLGGLSVEDDVQVDPRRLLPALEQAAASAGTQIRSMTAALGAEYDETAQTWLVRLAEDASDSGSVRAKQLLITAGPWCDQFLDLARTEPRALAPTRVGPVKGQLLRLNGERLVDRVIRTTNVDIAQRVDGELIVASTKEPEAGWDLSATDEARQLLLERAYGVLPTIREWEVAEQSVGLRPAVEDHLPVIGPAGGRDLWVASGHYRHGILLAPGTAYWLAEAMESDRIPAELAGYGLERPGMPQLGSGAAP